MNNMREQLKELMGETYKDLLEVFLSDSPKRMKKILLAVQENDMTTLASEAHALKGSSGNLGAQQLSGLCGNIEELAQSNSTEGLSSMLEGMEKHFRDLQLELEKDLTAIP